MHSNILLVIKSVYVCMPHSMHMHYALVLVDTHTCIHTSAPELVYAVFVCARVDIREQVYVGCGHCTWPRMVA